VIFLPLIIAYTSLGLQGPLGQGGREGDQRRQRPRLLKSQKEDDAMWYFSWLLGLPLAAAFAVLNAMWYELVDDDAVRKAKLETPEPAHGQERL
jgi:cyd operon protein YbgT